MSRIYVFWDNSNIFIAAQHVAATKDGVLQASSVRVDFGSLHHLATMGRHVVKTFVVGSVPPDLKVWASLEGKTGARLELFERGNATGTEQAVDAALQVQMLRALADEAAPAVAVLLTGDGAGYESGVGFYADLERMAKKGWGIEVLSWEHSCNKQLRKWATKAGVFVPLDKHYDQITFIERGRAVTPRTLISRKMAQAQTK
jgi:hypothetical protein